MRNQLGFEAGAFLNFDQVAKAAKVIFGFGGVVVAYPKKQTYMKFPQNIQASQKVVILRNGICHVDLFKDMVSAPSCRVAVEWLQRHGYPDSEVG